MQRLHQCRADARVEVACSSGLRCLCCRHARSRHEQNNQAACVQRLLQNGASVNVSSTDGWTALFDAAMSGSLEAAKVSRFTCFTCFTGTKLHRLTQLRQLLVAAGINVNAARSSGASPLHMSCLYAPPHSTGVCVCVCVCV